MLAHTELFRRSVQESEEWIFDLAERLHMDGQHALRALTAVMYALRDELSVAQNAALAAQLPSMLRGIYFQDWKPHTFQPAHADSHSFLDKVGNAFNGYELEPNASFVVEQVFGLFEERISGECRKIRRTLPGDLRKLWPAAWEECDEQ